MPKIKYLFFYVPTQALKWFFNFHQVLVLSCFNDFSEKSRDYYYFKNQNAGILQYLGRYSKSIQLQAFYTSCL